MTAMLVRRMDILAVSMAMWAIWIGAASACWIEGPDEKVPELKALNHYVGNFSVVMTIAPNDNSQKPTRFIGSSKCKWVLGGRFIEQTGKVAAEDGGNQTRVTTLATYDTEKKVYRSWSFFSTGAATEYTGVWDEGKKTLTSTSVNAPEGRVTTIVANFATAGEEHWTIVDKDRDGKVVSSMSGVNTAAKKK